MDFLRAMLLLLSVVAVASKEIGIVQHQICPQDSKQYSGYLPAGGGAEYFFWMAESRSENIFADPLTFWFNGGPGCASSVGLLSENGPCEVVGAKASGSDAGGWTLRKRSSSWTEVSNMVWVDQPSSVGYSYGSGQADTEAEVAEHMLVFFEHFFARFPEYSQLQVFLAGESYAGHYIPATATAFYQASLVSGKLHGIQLGGIALGNPYTQPQALFESYPDMAFNGGSAHGGSLKHGIIDRETYDWMKSILPDCLKGIQECQNFGKNCIASYNFCNQMGDVITNHNRTVFDLRRVCPGGEGCYNTSLWDGFLEDPDSQRLLGARQTPGWAGCRDLEKFFVASGDELADMESSVAFLLDHHVPVLLYVGDCDWICNFVGTKAWASKLKWTHGEAWAVLEDKPWVEDTHHAGMVRTLGRFTYLQVYNSGHMVPMDQPEVSLALFKEFIASTSPWRSASESTRDISLRQRPNDLFRLSVAPATLGSLLLCSSIGIALATLCRSSLAHARRPNTEELSSDYSYLAA
eukprot:TRINITY_DN111449_c0_g1_i1.p1 TRINITY_DN111449_c0_g1~~TRINITY_DN111449_c0_g1_i1.p1  ORF type:complete len:522 (+),score=57.39 TRINITY_DN111449_c0_g1_i1:65-1630(+)